MIYKAYAEVNILGEQRIAKKDLRVMDLGVCEDAVQ
jgi:hypothetical protein